MNRPLLSGATRLIALPLALAIISGCTVHRQNRTDFTPVELGSFEEEFPEENKKAHKAAHKHIEHRVFEQYDDFLLAHIEFDDQGQFWEKERKDNQLNQLDALEQHVKTDIAADPKKYENGAVIVAFAHGWNHNSEEGNENLQKFREVMSKLAAKEKTRSNSRPLIGVYLGWRGARVHHIGAPTILPYALTYWDRKETAQNIGQRTMGETLKRLSLLKADIVADGEGLKSQRDARSRLVLAGHSFGAAALFSGVSRFFEDELIEVKHSNYTRYVDRNWDLVVLINPAFEALLYSTIHRYNSMIPPDTELEYTLLPRLLVVGAENDLATGNLLPIGQTLGDLFRPRQHSEHLDEPTQMMTALGHHEPFMTHKLVPDSTGKKAVLKPYNEFKNLQKSGGTYAMAEYMPARNQEFLNKFDGLFADVEVKRVLPFMVAQADSSIVDNHNGIWKKELRDFIVDFIDAREEAVEVIKRNRR